MKRLIIPLLLVALGWNLALAAAAYSVHLPVVANGAPVATTCSSQGTLLLDQDTGAISATLDGNGRFLVAYQDRAHGSLIHVAQHQGDHLVELAAPPVQLADAQPQFSPDGPKQGPMSLVSMPNGKNRLYFTQRKLGDTTGPYGIWCLEF